MLKAVNRSRVEEEFISIFGGAVRIKYTLAPYELRLVAFLSDIGKTCDEFVKLAKTNPVAAQKMIIDFVLKVKQRAEHRSIVITTCQGLQIAEIPAPVHIRYYEVLPLLFNYLIQGHSYGYRVVVGKEVEEVLLGNELSS